MLSSPPPPPKSSLLLHKINTTPTNTATQCVHNEWFPLTCATQVLDTVVRYHTHPVGPNQCCSAVVQDVVGSVSTVWSSTKSATLSASASSVVTTTSPTTGQSPPSTPHPREMAPL
jgi:hypothetical protein